MLDDLTELRTFVRIATAGSLSAAAREMGLALSVVSKRLSTLEARTKTLLIARSTRRLSLTDEGTRLFERAQRILAEVGEAEAMLARGQTQAHGLLRISAPIALGRAHVSPVCQELARANPHLSIDLSLTDRVSALIDEGLDVAIRIGVPQDSALVVRRLADNHGVIVASAPYLTRHGSPRRPEDLADHDCLHQPNGATWPLIGPHGRRVELAVGSRLRCDNGEVWHDWATTGAGLAFKSMIDVADDLANGTLVRVLPEWQSPPAPVCALMLARNLVPTRVRLFLDAMADRFRHVPVREAG